MMADSQPTLNSLAAKITELSQKLTSSLEENNVPLCNFSVDSPAAYETHNPDIYMQRQTLIETLTDMIYLTQGPQESIFNYAHSVSVLIRFNQYAKSDLQRQCRMPLVSKF